MSQSHGPEEETEMKLYGANDGPKDVVADKRYHSNHVLLDLEALGMRRYISEPDRGRRKWKDNPDARDAGYRSL